MSLDSEALDNTFNAGVAHGRERYQQEVLAIIQEVFAFTPDDCWACKKIQEFTVRITEGKK